MLATRRRSHPIAPRVEALIERERSPGYRLEMYARFGEQVKETKRALLEFLIDAKRAGKKSSATARPARATRS